MCRATWTGDRANRKWRCARKMIPAAFCHQANMSAARLTARHATSPASRTRADITPQCNNWRTDTRRQFTAHAASTTRKIAPRGVLISQECSVMDQFSPATIFGIFLGQYLLNRFTANNVFYLEFCYSLYRVDQKMRPQTHGHNSVKY